MWAQVGEGGLDVRGVRTGGEGRRGRKVVRERVGEKAGRVGAM